MLMLMLCGCQGTLRPYDVSQFKRREDGRAGSLLGPGLWRARTEDSCPQKSQNSTKISQAFMCRRSNLKGRAQVSLDNMCQNLYCKEKGNAQNIFRTVCK